MVWYQKYAKDARRQIPSMENTTTVTSVKKRKRTGLCVKKRVVKTEQKRKHIIAVNIICSIGKNRQKKQVNGSVPITQGVAKKS